MEAPSDSAPVAHLGLVESATLIGGHRYLERELFALTGRWSVEAAGAAGAAGGGARREAAVAEFLATQSVIHSWRLSEWEQRSPRSVEASAEAGPMGWSQAYEAADQAPTVDAKMAVWCHVLGVSLAARYRQHRLMCAPAADQGVHRWLEIAEHDVLAGVAEGTTVAQRSMELADGGDRGARASACAGAVSAALKALVGGAV